MHEAAFEDGFETTISQKYSCEAVNCDGVCYHITPVNHHLRSFPFCLWAQFKAIRDLGLRYLKDCLSPGVLAQTNISNGDLLLDSEVQQVATTRESTW